MMPASTDWNDYYGRPYKAASLTRRYTGSVLSKLMTRYCRVERPEILELGGANSCFIDKIISEVGPGRYDVVDNNQKGLDLLAERFSSAKNVSALNMNILGFAPAQQYDIVYSVGLIEHFSQSGTAAAVQAHFSALKPGGLAIITFPTPTVLYRVTRWASETLGLWIFHDERPLELSEVLRATEGKGNILCKRILWPQVLTQYCVAVRKVAE